MTEGRGSRVVRKKRVASQLLLKVFSAAGERVPRVHRSVPLSAGCA